MVKDYLLILDNNFEIISNIITPLINFGVIFYINYINYINTLITLITVI